MNERKFPKLVFVSVALMGICWTVLTAGGVPKPRQPEKLVAPHPVSGDPDTGEASPFHSNIAKPASFVAWQSNLDIGGLTAGCF